MKSRLEELGAYARSLDCVHCGLCIESCPTYSVSGRETDSPRGRIYLMRALAEDRVADPEAIRPALDRCLGCRACETVCPSGVKYGELLTTVRSEMPPPRGLRARLRRALLDHVVAKPRRLRFGFTLAWLADRIGLRALARATGVVPATVDRLLPRIPAARVRRALHGVYRPSGTARGRVQLFTGCVMEQVFGSINRSTIALLVANGFEVDVPRTQVCCGALHLHDGNAATARQLARSNLAAFDGDAPIIHNSAGCGAALAEYAHLVPDAVAFGDRCHDVLAFLAGAGLRAEPAACTARVAYDAPCHLHHAQGVVREPIELLRRVPGIELTPHPTSDVCCGSAGIYNILQPEFAQSIGRAKADALIATGADVVATGNPGCMMQIRAHLTQRAPRMRVVHPVELLLPSDSAVPTPATS